MKFKQFLMLVLLIVFGIALFLNVSNSLNTIQTDENKNPYLDKPLEKNTSLNLISSIYLDFRFYDTIFEVLVFFVAAFGINVILEKLPVSKRTRPSTMVDTEAEHINLRMPASGSFIFILAFSLSVYIVFTGHVAPGGGFVGGVVAGTGLLVLSGSRDLYKIEMKMDMIKVHDMEKIIMLLIPATGIAGIIIDNSAFSNFLPLGEPGRLFSGGTAMLLNAFIGFKVFSGTWTILYNFVKHRGVI